MKVQGLLDLGLDDSDRGEDAAEAPSPGEIAAGRVAPSERADSSLSRHVRCEDKQRGRPDLDRLPRPSQTGSRHDIQTAKISRTTAPAPGLWDECPHPDFAVGDEAAPPPVVQVSGRRLQPSSVFDTYWRFAARRQAVYDARVAGLEGPWTDDPILRAHRFTNCFRAADRVSQFLIREVLYRGDQSPHEVVFRALIFKLFNKVETWQRLEESLGAPSWAGYDFNSYDQVLSSALDARQTLYSAAYVMPPPRLGEHRKHQNHLRLIELMMGDSVADKAAAAGSLREVYKLLHSYPAMGPFLAFQMTIDLNYSAVVNFSESDFVVAGPGAHDGIRKCFGPQSRGIEEDIIYYMTYSQNEHFERLGLSFTGLAGQRPLQPIDCQNLFCEVDKYSRVAHPDISGISGRTRIKQKYRRDHAPVSAWFPPKWGLNGDEPAAIHAG